MREVPKGCALCEGNIWKYDSAAAPYFIEKLSLVAEKLMDFSC